MSDRSDNAVLTVREALARLKVSRATFYRLIAAGHLDARKLLSRTVVTAESVDAFLAALPRIEPPRRARRSTGGADCAGRQPDPAGGAR